jgi:hypothetical protein
MPYREEKGVLNPNDIQLKNFTYSIEMIMELIVDEEIEIYSNLDIKTISNTDKSLLIESILLNIPTPPIYFEESISDYTHRKWKPIRGYTMLKTIKEFIIDEVFELTDLEFLPQINHSNYRDLPRTYSRRIDIYTINIVLLKAGTSELAKYAIYKRLNMSEGLFTPEQIDYIIKKDKEEYRLVHEVVSLIKKSNLFWNKNLSPTDLEDLASRYLIFKNGGYSRYYSPFEIFKSERLRQVDYARTELSTFARTLDSIKSTFGNSLFEIDNKFYPTLFELWSIFLTEQRVIHFDRYQENNLFTSISKLYNGSDFLKSLKSDTKKNVEYRFDKFEKFIRELY